MLRELNIYRGCSLEATDGIIGRIQDFYFDDLNWTIRYVVLDTGSWLTGRMVLILPKFLGHPTETEGTIPVNLSKKQIEESPPISSAKPVSRQHEADLLTYYGIPFYWGGMFAYDSNIAEGAVFSATPPASKQKGDPHLRSTERLKAYAVEAVDGEFGEIDAFIVDNETWTIRYLIIDTTKWWPGGRILFPPFHARKISWRKRVISVPFSQEGLKQAPQYKSSLPISGEFERQVLNYFNQQALQKRPRKKSLQTTR